MPASLLEFDRLLARAVREFRFRLCRQDDRSGNSSEPSVDVVCNFLSSLRIQTALKSAVSVIVAGRHEACFSQYIAGHCERIELVFSLRNETDGEAQRSVLIFSGLRLHGYTSLALSPLKLKFRHASRLPGLFAPLQHQNNKIHPEKRP